MNDADTIVAVSTSPGRGGIGVVRLSGPRAHEIAAGLFRGARKAAHGSVVFGRFVDAAGEVVDHGYLVTFAPPATFTGEPTAELWAHGSPATLRLLTEAAVARGARPATPGEFTLRAFLNGRIDATQAEAIRDLIEARTAFQAKVALDQVEGRISAAVDRLKDRLAEIVARLEAGIEFAEEPDASRFVPDGGLRPDIEALERDVQRLAGTYERGRHVRGGAVAVLAGAPNVGKSSLFNRLLEEERAIVTPVAGTTRDVLEETLDLGGIPVTLLDTAGLQETSEAPGVEAVRRSRKALRSADLAIVVFDASRAMARDEEALLDAIDPARRVIVLNKVDLPRGLDRDTAARLATAAHDRLLEVSAATGHGLDALRRRLAESVAGGASSREEAFITNLRHRDLLVSAAAALRRAVAGPGALAGAECVLLDLREALDRLGEITGEVGVEGIYERIFSRFCIGK